MPQAPPEFPTVRVPIMQVPLSCPDFAGIDTLDGTQRKALANEIRAASENVGFFYLTNHGIPDDIIQAALAGGKQLFALPHDAKMEPDIICTRGYRPAGGFNIDPTQKGDLVESMIVGWEPKDGAPQVENNDCGRHLAGHMYSLIALAMEQNEDFFASSVLRFLRYPEVAEETNGTGSHAEYVFTVLWQQPARKGLQVLTPAGEWIDVPPIPGHLIVNLGDQMSRLTNGVFRSAQHRVISQPGGERYSIPLFFFADFDAPLEPLPRFISTAQPIRYETVSAGDQLGKLSLDAGGANNPVMVN
ncbi:2OG-Fe-II oxygenase [Mycena leptocephala]|nr:2OG-Fe-II oxygenase [Mycena leptocephala]